MHRELDPELYAALGAHGSVYQAQGMVMVDLDVSLIGALARLRAHAFAHAFACGQDLSALAGEIVAGTTRLDR